jgi:hypothetical protein
MKKFDYLVVLCASSLNNGQFDDLDKNGTYLGGNVRMKAALELKDRTDKFVVVGGGMEKDGDEKWRKTKDMFRYLVDNGVNPKRIIRISSMPDTLGNLRAVYICLRGKFNLRKVGILTNYYHLPRAMTFAADIFAYEKYSFIPISAESVAGGFPFKYWPQLNSRIGGEINGLSDWEKGKYEDQGLPIREWKGEIYKGDKNKI